MEDNKDTQLKKESLLKRLTPLMILRGAVWCVFLILFILVTVNKHILTSGLYDQQADCRWTEKGKGSSQVSIFLNEDVKLDDMAIGFMRYKVSTSLKSFIEDENEDIPEDAIPTEEEKIGFASQNAMLEGPYAYAYSARGSIYIASSDEKSKIISDADAIGVGGDFFLFHPLKLKSGRYFDDTELMNDAVIIDSNTAFRLFGSYDCIGKMVMVGNVPHYVRGVYDPDDSKYSAYAGASGGYVFMYYSSLEKNGTASNVNCVEFVAKDPYNGFLYNYLKDAKNTGLTEGTYTVVQNSGRFEVASLLTNVISVWGARSMQTNALVYPYWENIARAYEDICGVILIAQMISLAILFIGIFAVLHHLYKHRSVHMKILYDKFDDLLDKRRVKNYERLKNKNEEE